MDGGGRLPQSLKVWFRSWLPNRDDALITARESARALVGTVGVAKVTTRQVKRKARSLKQQVVGESVYIPRLTTADFDQKPEFVAALERYVPPHGVGKAATFAFVLACGLYGLWWGGGMERARILHGTPVDMAARLLGFGIEEVSVSGNRELAKQEIVNLSGVTNVQSLAILDADAVKERLVSEPLIATAEVRKLFPNRLSIAITERTPAALWQKDGDIHLVSADGNIIDRMRDARFVGLPHVVGQGANKRAAEYVSLLEAAGPLRPRIRAGVLVGERRWNLKLANGVDVLLPENEPAMALKQLVRLEREAQVLEKAIISVDLRVAGRAGFRLTEEAAAQRAEALKTRLDKKGKA
jgi:cell division protein FtsQ